WLLLPDYLLHAVEVGFALRRIDRAGLRFNEPIDLGFPGRFRRLLAWIPLMIGRRTEPDIALAVRIEIHVHQSEQAGVVLLCAADALDERWKIERHQADFDAKLCEVLLDQRAHLGARLISRVGDDGEFDWMAGGVDPAA